MRSRRQEAGKTLPASCRLSPASHRQLSPGRASPVNGSLKTVGQVSQRQLWLILTGVGGSAFQGGDGIYGEAFSGGWAAFFYGNVAVDGTLSKAAGSFKIDHPLDPKSKYLFHSFVESPDMMNIYHGNVTTDAQGAAVVQPPEWFDALNRDFRYQLTVIGQFAQAMMASELANLQFSIKTDKPNVKVSWQVTGVRQDAWANAHRIPVEVEKTGEERGRYIHPELHGASREEGIHWARHHKTMKGVRGGIVPRSRVQPGSQPLPSRKKIAGLPTL